MDDSDDKSQATSVVSDGSVDPADGEYQVLFTSLDDEAVPLTPQLKRTLSWTTVDDKGLSVYGNPLSAEDAASQMPPSDVGLIWHATIIPDAFFDAGNKLSRGLNKRDFDADNRRIKPRRPSLLITSKNFFSSLTKIDGPNGPRYIFSGVLNGWPSLRCFELLELEGRRDTSTGLPSAKEVLTGQILWKKTWSVDEEGRRGIEPSLPAKHQVYRARLRAPKWSVLGWSEESPGYVFWFEALRNEGPRLSFGTNLLKVLGNEKCSMIHMVSHRYAVPRESPRDRLTYHSVCFLEWEHGEYGTVVESAYLNGMGGYKGKSNWFDDRDESLPSLYKALPPEMICPWRTTSMEIRCYDVQWRDLSEFRAYIEKYTGANKRFVDPHFTFSHRARLGFRSKNNIAHYLLNYILRDSSYGELKRNCQTFTADLCSFVAGKREVPPFHPVNRIDYQNRTYLFLYDSHMYASRLDKRKKSVWGND